MCVSSVPSEQIYYIHRSTISHFFRMMMILMNDDRHTLCSIYSSTVASPLRLELHKIQMTNSVFTNQRFPLQFQSIPLHTSLTLKHFPFECRMDSVITQFNCHFYPFTVMVQLSEIYLHNRIGAAYARSHFGRWKNDTSDDIVVVCQ